MLITSPAETAWCKMRASFHPRGAAMPGFRALLLSLAIFSWIPAVSSLAAEQDDALGGDPATADLSPKWRPISYWFGNLDSKKHAYATREPGSFGAAFSSPNAVHE